MNCREDVFGVDFKFQFENNLKDPVTFKCLKEFLL